MPNEKAKADSDAGDDQLADLLRELGESLQGSDPLDWRESWARSNDVLQAHFERCARSQALAAAVEGKTVVKGGAEHLLIQFESQPERYFKTTYGGAFGCRSELYPHEPEGNHFHAMANGDPRFYFRRWKLLNSIGEYETRYEGILPPDLPNGLYRICVSQAAMPAANPTESEIRTCLGRYGFDQVCRNAYFHREARMLLTDAAPRNVRVIAGIPVPFDAIAEEPEGLVLEWILEKLRQRESA